MSTEKRERQAEFIILAPQRIEYESLLDVFDPAGIGDVAATSHRVSLTNGTPGIIVRLPHIGRVSAAVVTTQLMHEFAPSVLLLLGTAGGFGKTDGVRLGELVVATEIVDFEEQRLVRDRTEYRPRVFHPSVAFVAEARDLVAYRRASTRASPWVNFGPMLSGDKVLASASASRQIREVSPESLGVEMEGSGVAAAIELWRDERPEFLMVRGIVDLSDSAKRMHSASFGRKTCIELAEFARDLLQRHFK